MLPIFFHRLWGYVLLTELPFLSRGADTQGRWEISSRTKQVRSNTSDSPAQWAQHQPSWQGTRRCHQLCRAWSVLSLCSPAQKISLLLHLPIFARHSEIGGKGIVRERYFSREKLPIQLQLSQLNYVLEWVLSYSDSGEFQNEFDFLLLGSVSSWAGRYSELDALLAVTSLFLS